VCGRFSVGRPPGDVAAEFEAADMVGDLGPDYNVAPGKPVAAVVSRPPLSPGGPRRRELRLLRWGLVPSWADTPDQGARLINARAESVAERPSFRDALAARRCLIPADGWYEWAGRQPYYITARDGSLLALAGLYEFWGTGADRLVTCAIVTTAAVGALAEVHERMPLVTPRSHWSRWLDPAADVTDLLRPPAPAVVDGLELRPVSARVGNVANNGPALLIAVPPAPEPDTLF
jgi:putative SOS response-associated peptidase YedK